MNRGPKPRTALSREELLQAMELVRELIPEDTFDQFLDQAYSAIEIYLDLGSGLITRIGQWPRERLQT